MQWIRSFDGEILVKLEDIDTIYFEEFPGQGSFAIVVKYKGCSAKLWVSSDKEEGMRIFEKLCIDLDFWHTAHLYRLRDPCAGLPCT